MEWSSYTPEIEQSDRVVENYNPADFLEQTTVPSSEKAEVTKESIFTYYNVPNEVAFIRNNKELPQEQKEYYLRENIHTFLGEFAAQIEHRDVTYILKPDGLYYGHIKAMDSWNKAAQMAGPGSREADEGYGFWKGQELFLGQPPADLVIAQSPPKIAGYAFMFLYERGEYDTVLGGEKVTMHALRYPEKMNTVKRSNEILHKLSNGTMSFPDTKSFLRNPLGVYTANVEREVWNAMNAAGITDREIARSKKFEQEVERQLTPWINEYMRAVFTMSELPEDSDEQPLYQHVAEKLLIRIFNRAETINQALNNPDDLAEMERMHASMNHAQLLDHYGKREAIVQGGGSCPVTTSSGEQHEFISSFNLMELMNEGKPVELTLQENKNDYLNDPNLCRCGRPSEPHFHCPGKIKMEVGGKDAVKTDEQPCQHPIVVGAGVTKCPTCGEEATCK